MIKNILQTLVNSIKSKLPEFTKGLYLAFIDSEGRVLIQEEKTNEFVYSGIGDNSNNYFYVRHRNSGEIRFTELSTNKQFVSCNQNSGVSIYELRIVACVKNWCPYELEHRLRKAIIATSISDFNLTGEMIKNISFKPVASNVDSIQVLKEESPKPKQFDKNLIFVSIDFDLSLNYHLT